MGRTLQPGQWLHYHRAFTPPGGQGGRVLLHFGAVDYACAVEVNGHLAGGTPGRLLALYAGHHRPAPPAGPQHPLGGRAGPHREWHAGQGQADPPPGGMFYHAQSGIWQTVWLERVPDNYITELTVTPDYDARTVTVKPTRPSPAGQKPLGCGAGRGRDHCRGLGRRRGRPGRRGDAEHPGETFLSVESGQPVPLRPDRGYHPGDEDGFDTVHSYFALRKWEL